MAIIEPAEDRDVVWATKLVADEIELGMLHGLSVQ